MIEVDNEKLKSTWKEVLEEMMKTIKQRNRKTGVVKKEYLEVFRTALDKYELYFSKVKSQFYFDDMNSKNVIINNGNFNGLVDLDNVAYGDFLEGIGRIKASWFGTKYGDTYSQAVMNSLNLDEKQREIVVLYAFLNRVYWLSEIGIRFNQNTSKEVDFKKVESSYRAIDGLIKELKLS